MPKSQRQDGRRQSLVARSGATGIGTRLALLALMLSRPHRRRMAFILVVVSAAAGLARGRRAEAQELASRGGAASGTPGAVKMAGAAPSAPPGEAALSGRLRVALPLAHVTFGSDMLPIASLTAGIAWRGKVALEGGVGSNSPFPDDSRPEYFARMGWTPTVRDWRASDGRGWKAQLNLLAGWRRLDRFHSPDGHDGEEISDNITGHFGIEWSDWSHGAKTALLLRVLCGAVVPVHRRASGYFDDNRGYERSFQPIGTMVDINFDLGVAF